MPSRALRLALLLAPSLLLLAISALIILLERITRSLFLSHTSRNLHTGDRTLPDNDLTINEDPAPALAFLGTSVLGVLVACISVAGMWELRRVNGVQGAGQRAWCWGVVGMNMCMLGVGVGVLAWASGLQSAQAGVDLSSGREYTRETWACGIESLDKGSVCGLAKATRFMLIPVAVSSALAMVAVWFAAKQRGGTAWLFGGKGRYAGFQSVYELGPQGPPPQYQHAAPQFYPQPVPYGYPQPVYVVPPQGFQQGPFQPQPGAYPPAPQVQKGAVAGEQAVFR